MIRAATLVLTGYFWCALTAAAAPLEVGTARADITPPTGYPMWGYAARRDAPSVGVHDPLHAGVVVIGVDKTRLAIVSLDLGRAPTRASMATIRKRVKEAAGIDHVLLVASHTHHGPVLELDNWPKEGKPYVRQLEDKLVDAMTAAAKDLRPAKMGIVSVEVDLNRNRHSKNELKPVDRTLTVVRFESADGKALAHLVNFAAHPTMIDAAVREFSADFPGHMARYVEKELGGVCLFLQGAEGDLSPKAPPGKAGPQLFGAELGRRVVDLAKKLPCSAAEVSGLKVRERDFVFGSRIDLGNPLVHAAYSLAFFPELVNFYEREYREGVRPHLTTALLDGRIGFVGVSGELFCGHALHLRKRAGLEHLLVLGCCNDYQQYFPTIEAVAEGGYGADATVSPVEIGAGERIVDRALIDLFEMRGKIRKVELPK